VAVLKGGGRRWGLGQGNEFIGGPGLERDLCSSPGIPVTSLESRSLWKEQTWSLKLPGFRSHCEAFSPGAQSQTDRAA
jgi:hypothetical protein